MWLHAAEIVRAALDYGIPTVGDSGEFIDAGALAAYSYIGAEADVRTASYVDRILRGAKPGELPVEQPTQVWMGLNLKTARTLGITVPESVVLHAVRVVR
jgi:putative ABC transport system substrate-binding protein